MDKIKTNIKERVLQIAKSKGISYEFFFNDLGISYSNFKGKQRDTSLQSDSIEKIISKYTDIDLHWLLTGQTKYSENEAINKVSEPSNETGYRDKYFECAANYMKLNEEIIALKSANKNSKNTDE
ncbi:DNA-binding protein [Flavobacteriaceae bacterium]|nr:DNA-binding protein [Flavobacteriaceae bacterium]